MLSLDRILVPLDFSDASLVALRRGVDLARRAEAELHLIHVVPGFDPLSGDDVDALEPEDQAFYRRVWARAEHDLDAVLGRVDVRGVVLRRVLSYGLPSRVVLDYARRQEADLVVMGTHGRRGLRRFMLGSVAEEVLRRAETPVLVVPETASGTRPFFHILAPTDFSLASRLALPVAADLAERYGAQLDLLHAVEPVPFLAALTGVRTAHELFPDLRAEAERELARWAEDGGPGLARAGRHVVDGKAEEAIAAFVAAHGVDLVVMAKHGLHGAERLLIGSVTERVLRAAPCSLLTLPVDAG